MQIIQEWQSRDSAVYQRMLKAQQVTVPTSVNFAIPCSISEITAEMWQHSHLSRDQDSILWLFLHNGKSQLLSCWLVHHLSGLYLQNLNLLTSDMSAPQSKETFSKRQNSTQSSSQGKQQSQCCTHSNSLSINSMIRREILKALWTVPCNHHPNVQHN